MPMWTRRHLRDWAFAALTAACFLASAVFAEIAWSLRDRLEEVD